MRVSFCLEIIDKFCRNKFGLNINFEDESGWAKAGWTYGTASHCLCPGINNQAERVKSYEDIFKNVTVYGH